MIDELVATGELRTFRLKKRDGKPTRLYYNVDSAQRILDKGGL